MNLLLGIIFICMGHPWMGLLVILLTEGRNNG